VKQMRLPAAAFALLTGSGCSILFHGAPPPEQTYFLRVAEPSTAAPDPPPQVHASLRVMHPAANPGLDTPRIVLLEPQQRMGFYAGSHWPASLPDLVEALAVETLRSSGAWVSIQDSASPFPSDYLLQITIRRFEADYASGGSSGVAFPRVHVVLECSVGRGDGRDVMASYVAEGTATPTANRLADVVAAFQSASSAALKTLSERALEAVRADSRRSS
jgi:cholesterol transport system auxiliary component